jgi:hypothetical protein
MQGTFLLRTHSSRKAAIDDISKGVHWPLFPFVRETVLGWRTSSIADKPLISREIASLSGKRAAGEQHRKAVHQGVSTLAPHTTDRLAGQLQ